MRPIALREPAVTSRVRDPGRAALRGHGGGQGAHGPEVREDGVAGQREQGRVDAVARPSFASDMQLADLVNHAVSSLSPPGVSIPPPDVQQPGIARDIPAPHLAVGTVGPIVAHASPAGSRSAV